MRAREEQRGLRIWLPIQKDLLHALGEPKLAAIQQRRVLVVDANEETALAAVQDIGQLAFSRVKVFPAPLTVPLVSDSCPRDFRAAAQSRNVPSEQISAVVAIKQDVSLQPELGLRQLRDPLLEPAHVLLERVAPAMEIVRCEFWILASLWFNRHLADAMPIARRDQHEVPGCDRSDSPAVT